METYWRMGRSCRQLNVGIRGSLIDAVSGLVQARLSSGITTPLYCVLKCVCVCVDVRVFAPVCLKSRFHPSV
jgi:hypothetical protein